ncbi:MAG: sugar transferase [Bryobacteraceae bacterium]|nr:sugar transferase [Bryobacteraceae bacterium]
MPSADKVLKTIQEMPYSENTPLIQRVWDCLIASAVLLLTLPLQLVIAIAVRLDSPGPVLFQQWRVGRYGLPFRFRKFRTMVANADDLSPHKLKTYSSSELGQLYFKVPRDRRVTRIGAFLRATSLDELPSLFNVVCGEMALVGPRPEVLEVLPYYAHESLIKFSVRPGITGLAQVSGRSRLKFLEGLELDCQYVRRRSPLLDLQIFLRTFVVVLRRDGAF